MDWANVLREHWFELLQTASILVGLFATAHTIRADTRERKIENLFAVTAAHRDLWSQFYQQPGLPRVLDADVNLSAEPPTLAEQRFVHELILHLRASFKARQAGMDFDDDAVAADVRQFFSLPLPHWVWLQSKVFQDADFVSFVESCLKTEPPVDRRTLS